MNIMSNTEQKSVTRYESILEAAKNSPDLDESLCGLYLNLLRTGDAVSSMEERYLARHGISPGRFSLLVLLGSGEETELKPSELADMTGVTRATITGLLDTLEKDGYIRREADQTDRRATKIKATSQGRERLGQLLPGYLRFVSAVSATLTIEEQEQLARLTAKVNDGLMLAEGKFFNGNN